jgi:hypothetical protein
MSFFFCTNQVSTGALRALAAHPTGLLAVGSHFSIYSLH